MKRDKTDITPDTKVADLLNDYPETEGVLLELSAAFAALKNPVLRRTVAKVTSLQQAAKVGGINIVEMVDALRQKAGLGALGDITYDSSDNDTVVTVNQAPKADRLLDVCHTIAEGNHPKDMVLQAAEELAVGQTLELVTPFVPSPIIDILRSKGFAISIMPPSEGKVRTFILKQ